VSDKSIVLLVFGSIGVVTGIVLWLVRCGYESSRRQWKRERGLE
jgi:hypothetical protein